MQDLTVMSKFTAKYMILFKYYVHSCNVMNTNCYLRAVYNYISILNYHTMI